jgi:protein pelota
MFRKVQHESGGGKVSSTKKKLIITIKIEEIEYCQEDDIIRIKGKNTSENEYISIGQFQTAEISKGSFFTLFKYYWDDIHIETLKNATDKTITSDVAAIIMEEGIAHLYFINNNQTVLHGKINQSIPKKRNGSTQYNKSKKNFFTKILNNLVKEINFENCKCVIIASPGFTKDEFGNFMTDEINNNLKVYQTIKNNLSKIIYCHSSSGYKQSLEEILSKPEIKKLIKDTKCIEENTIMEKFNEILGTEMDKAFFGLKSFEIAYSNNAINTVILTDNFLRKISPTTRKKLSLNLKNLKNKGIQVFKFSSQHVTGEKVDAFGGIIGILNYVVPEISELGGDDLDINDQKDDEDVKEEKNNEILEEMIKDNKTNYVVEDDDDKDN